MPPPKPIKLAEVIDGVRLRLNFHPGQYKAWQSTKRFIAVIAGSQSGKTSYGPYWLWREIQRCGPGDYMAIAPSYPLMSKKLFPEFYNLFGRRMRLGYYKAGERTYYISEEGQQRLWGKTYEEPTKIFFCHASDSESLESATAKAAWLDEAGQKRFRLSSWEAIQRRLSLHQGRALITTTPYDLGWLKQKLYDPWIAAGKNHPDIDVIRFDSTENPAFSKEEFQRARETLPRWKFDLFYRGIFTRPAGLIYDTFDSLKHLVPRFRPPSHWERYGGVDFGAVNTAAVLLAEELDSNNAPTGRFIAYREYAPGKRTPEQHTASITADEPRLPLLIGGSASEDEWRSKFALQGLPIQEPPIRDVEVGIDTVYALFAQGRLLIMDDLSELIDQLNSYSRVLDDAGEPTAAIDAKETYHLLDALRYVCSWLHRGPAHIPMPGVDRTMASQAPQGVWLT